MRPILAVALALALAAGSILPAAAFERTFPETGQTVRDAFLDFFDANGGVELFGYPRTGEFTEGGRYVQYFQRARLEYWPENPPGQQVQLGNLGLDLGPLSPAERPVGRPRPTLVPGDAALHRRRLPRLLGRAAAGPRSSACRSATS